MFNDTNFSLSSPSFHDTFNILTSFKLISDILFPKSFELDPSGNSIIYLFLNYVDVSLLH